MIYIEALLTDTSYMSESFFERVKQETHYQCDWPMVGLNGYYDEALRTKAMHDFVNNRRARPSHIMSSSAESGSHVAAQKLGMEGANFTVSATCTGSIYGFVTAHAISAQVGTPVLVYGASTLPEGHFSDYWFKSLRAIDRNTGIPFDRDSKGFAPGDGTMVAVISAKPINPVATIDYVKFFTMPDERTDVGSLDRVKEKLFKGVDVSDVSWWNAHAPGTPMGDAAEYALFNDVIGDRNIPISSLKGKLGHCLAISYGMEISEGIKSIQSGVIPPNERLNNPIANDQRIITQPVAVQGNTFLKFNMGFSGRNVLSKVTVL